MHGGAKGSGAPSGPANGSYVHGQRTNEAAMTRRMVRQLMRDALETVCSLPVDSPSP
jgi:hypothetical protein